MAKPIFKDTGQTLEALLGDIQRGKLALPDIQRPFVWKKAKVRDLLDSMYRGFPIGYLMIWNTSDTTHKAIGADTKEFAPNSMVIDGQQRLTSLYAVMRGAEVVFENFSTGRIRIAFRPRDEKFAVADAATDRDPEFLPDISTLWTERNFVVVNEFIERLRKNTPDGVDEQTENDLRTALGELTALSSFPLQSVQIGAEVDEEQVAEIFLRVNSGAQRLKQADFILTLLSVFRESDRRRLEEFAEDAVTGSLSGEPSAFNHLIAPRADQLLRAAVLLGFRRGSLKSVLALLRGADPEGQELEDSEREAHLDDLEAAITRTLDLTNWHEFLKVAQIAGFRRSQEISSDNVIMYSYGIYLIGRYLYGLSHADLRGPIARFFFMTALTGRYSGSSETQVSFDVQTLTESAEPSGFLHRLEDLVKAELTSDFWTTTLPERLSTSSARSPGLFAYAASLNLLDARVPPFGPASGQGGTAAIRIRDLLDPAISAKKQPLERHHLFPRAFLERQGVLATSKINQIANLAYVEWPENLKISDQGPKDYWPPVSTNFTEEDLFNHALPPDWHLMEYDDFLAARRTRIAEVVRKGFLSIGGTDDAPPVAVEGAPLFTAGTGAVNQARTEVILQRLEGVVTVVTREVDDEILRLMRSSLVADSVSEVRLMSESGFVDHETREVLSSLVDEMARREVEVEWRRLNEEPDSFLSVGLIADDDQVFEIPYLGAEAGVSTSPPTETDIPVSLLNTLWDEQATLLGVDDGV